MDDAESHFLTRTRQSCPAFVIARQPDHAVGRLDRLRVQWDKGFWIIPGEGEGVLGRWLCTSVTGWASMDPTGVPAPISAASEFTIFEVFSGAGSVAVTNTRIVGFLGPAQSVAGSIGAGDEGALVFVVGLEEVREITLLRRRGLLGLKDAGLSLRLLHLPRFGALTLDLDTFVSESRTAYRGFSKKPKAESAMTFVRAIVEAQRSTAPSEKLALLDEALAGQWKPDGDDLTLYLEPSTEA